MWSFVAAKRAINTGVVVKDSTVIVSHGDENIDVNELGMIAALDGSATGDIKTTKWAVKGTEFAFSSPVIDGTRVYQIDGGSTMHAFDIASGKELWTLPLSTAQKAPPVFADGKIYVGTDGGKFFIVRPGADQGRDPERGRAAEQRHQLLRLRGHAGAGARPARPSRAAASSSCRATRSTPSARGGPPARTGLAVNTPAEAGTGRAGARAGDADRAGADAGADGAAARRGCSTTRAASCAKTRPRGRSKGLKGTLADGAFTVAADPVEQAGLIKATVGGLTGQARARVVRPLPWTETFDSYADGAAPPGWVNAVAGKIAVATLDGQKVLQKAPDETIFKRIRAFIGPTNWSNYSFEADVRAATRRRQQGDVGITAQRYSLVLYGNSQKLKIEAWEPETTRTVTVPFEWKPDTWYRLKLRVENLPNGAVRAQGKAWAVGQPEPAAWTIEKVEPNGNREGAPGLFIDAQFGAMLDNFKLSAELRGTNHDPRGFRELFARALAAAVVGARGDRRRAWRCARRPRRSGDWPMWGGTPDRNMVSSMKGLPARLGREDQEEREVGGRPRLAELRQPGGGRRHGLRRHQQRAGARPEAARRPRRADGVPRVHRRVPVAARARRSSNRAAPTTGRSRAWRRRRWSIGDRLYYVSNRGVLFCLDIQGFRDNENDGAKDEKLTGHDRRRRGLGVRHDGGGRAPIRTTCRTRRRWPSAT